MGTMKKRNLDKITEVLLNFDPMDLEFKQEQLYKKLRKLVDQGFLEPLLAPTHENAHDYYLRELLKEFKRLVNLYFNNEMINSNYNFNELVNLAKKYEREVIQYEHDNIPKS